MRKQPGPGRDYPLRGVTEDVSMWDDPQESAGVRQLLRVGRVDQVDYDVDAGLARHLANLQSGAPLPAWAVAQSTVQKGWSLSLLAWLLPPMISATIVGSWIYLRPAEPSLSPLPAAPAAAVLSHGQGPLQLPAAHVPAPIAPQPAAAAVPAAEPAVVRELELAQDASKLRVAQSSRTARHGASTHRVRVASVSNVDRDVERARGSEPALESGGSLRGIASAAPAASSATPASHAAPASSSATVNSVASASASAAESPSEPTPTAKPQAHKEPVAERRAEGAEPQSPRDNGISEARLEREMQMLAVAQRVLSTDPERSLRLTRQGEQEFRGSMFSAERTQVSLLALVQLGRLDEARRLGAPFLRAYPNAPWSARLREALATGRLPRR